LRRLAALVVVLLAICLAGCEPTADSSTGASRADNSDHVATDEASGIEVPDVTGEDGDDAISTIETEGLTTTLADANDAASFDTSRDVAGCEVTDQSPAAGDTVEEADEVEITVDCAQVDWENHEGPDWEAFDEAYDLGFDDACRMLFDSSPNGSLYENDSEYTVDDCWNLNPVDAAEASDVPTDVPDDPESAGTEVGELDGCQSLFEEEGVLSLNYGPDSITEDECPIGAAPPPPPKRKRRSGGRSTKGAGDTCTATQTDGAPITVQIEAGEINCHGAETLWNEYGRRAPAEGQGSGAALELEGWNCIAASAASAPRLGGCSRTDGAAEFTVYEVE
jgi:hypothetical protein